MMHHGDPSWGIIMVHYDGSAWWIIMAHLHESSWWKVMIILIIHHDESWWFIMINHHELHCCCDGRGVVHPPENKALVLQQGVVLPVPWKKGFNRDTPVYASTTVDTVGWLAFFVMHGSKPLPAGQLLSSQPSTGGRSASALVRSPPKKYLPFFTEGAPPPQTPL